MKASRNYIIASPVVVPPVATNKIITTITFASNPSAAIATRPLIKYNKKNWLSLEWDDASLGSILGKQILDGATFTDGCGNNVNYKAAIAFNGAYEQTGVEYSYDTGLTKSIMRSMIVDGWDFQDHGYYHDPVAFGANITPYQSTLMMRDYVFRLLGYWVRGKVVPTNYAGHATAARDLGYLFSTSQGTFDGFTPEWMYAPPGNYATLPAGFAALRRDFTDVWTNTTELKSAIDSLLASSGKFYRIGSHTIDVGGYQDFVDYIRTQANDELLVATTREILEYREVSSLPTSQTLSGNTLTITTDISGLDPKNRWKDQTFLIDSDEQITGVSTNYGTQSFNPTTGLVNTFSKVDFWDSDGSLETLNSYEAMASNVYYASDSRKYNATGVALNNDSVGLIVDKKGTGRDLQYAGVPAPAVVGRPPILSKLSSGRSYITFENIPYSNYSTSGFSVLEYPHAMTFVLESLPGQSYEAWVSNFGSRNYIGHTDDGIRVASDAANYTIPGSNPEFFRNDVIHVEYDVDYISVWLNGVYKGRVVNNIQDEGSDTGKINNALGTPTNSANFNWYASYIWYPDTFNGLKINRESILNSIGNKWQQGKTEDMPYADNIQTNFNNTSREWSVTFTPHNASQEQINSTSYKWFLWTANGDPGNDGQFYPQHLVSTDAVCRESDYQQYLNQGIARTLSCYVNVGDDWQYIKGPAKTVS